MSDIDVITVAAWKGGVGKTTLAYELAYQLDAVLIDLDWDGGGASVAWGYRHEQRKRAPLLDALASESDKTPTPLSGGDRKPDLLPSHPDLAVLQPDPETVADRISRWAADWGRPVVVDTHPGGNDLTYGAMAASRVLVVPVMFGTKELNALERMLGEVPDYPLLVVPNIVRAPSKPQRDRLRTLVEEAKVPVAPPVPYAFWIPYRRVRTAITSEPIAKRAEEFTAQIRAVAEAVRQYS